MLFLIFKICFWSVFYVEVSLLVIFVVIDIVGYLRQNWRNLISYQYWQDRFDRTLYIDYIQTVYSVAEAKAKGYYRD